MSRQQKTKAPVRTGKRNDPDVRWTPVSSHPSHVSGMFGKDPTFKEFRKLLRQQRQEDYQQVNEAIDAVIRKEEEDQGCLSSTPTLLPTTKTGTHS